MNTVKVEGADKGKILLYALSTCIWCKKTKSFLEEKGIAYEYIFVDELEGSDKDGVKSELKKWNPDCSYPTMVINENKCIVGFDSDEIIKELGL